MTKRPAPVLWLAGPASMYFYLHLPELTIAGEEVSQLHFSWIHISICQAVCISIACPIHISRQTKSLSITVYLVSRGPCLARYTLKYVWCIKHHKNCECCHSKLTGLKDCHEFRFSIVRIVSNFDFDKGHTSLGLSVSLSKLSKIVRSVKTVMVAYFEWGLVLTITFTSIWQSTKTKCHSVTANKQANIVWNDQTNKQLKQAIYFEQLISPISLFSDHSHVPRSPGYLSWSQYCLNYVCKTKMDGTSQLLARLPNCFVSSRLKCCSSDPCVVKRINSESSEYFLHRPKYS